MNTNKIEIISPQFDRVDGKKPTTPPSTVEGFDELKTLGTTKLKDMGLEKWDESGLMLFPKEWYDYIPENYPITTIFGNSEVFHRGKTDNDTRFGVLGYGIVSDKV